MSSLAAVVDTLQEQNRSMETVKDGILTLVRESENARVAYERGAGDRAESAREKRKERQQEYQLLAHSQVELSKD